MSLRAICASILLGVVVCAMGLPVAGAPNSGKISGVVLDSTGTPQLGATVFVTSDLLPATSSLELLTNDRGGFSIALPSGAYSIKVTLAGFLPVIEGHILVNDGRTTLLQIVLGTVFSSLEKLRRQPDEQVAADEWTWVLRSSSATRPILRWQDDDVTLTGGRAVQFDTSRSQADRIRFELTSGSDHPGSISNAADSPGTAFVYDLGLGENEHLLMASQFSYDGGSFSGGFATQWIPSGEEGVGPVTTLLIRESRLGQDGPSFRGMRLSHDDSFSMGGRVSIRYGADLLVAGLSGTTTAMRPRAEVAVQLSSDWRAAVLVSTNGWQNSSGEQNILQSGLNTLDEFPTLLARNGHSVLQNDLHEEIAFERTLDKNSSVTFAFFNDRSTHTPVFGHGAVSGSDYVQDFFSNMFAYDAGDSSSRGARVAYDRKFSGNVGIVMVYEYAGALSPTDGSAEASLRDQLATKYHMSAGTRVTAKIPRLNTKFSAGYKFVNGRVVSPVDAYGESVYHLDPYFSLKVQQPLPGFIPGHAEVVADCGNLFSQGYVSMSTSDGHVVLFPTYRFLRGGLSFQF